MKVVKALREILIELETHQKIRDNIKIAIDNHKSLINYYSDLFASEWEEVIRRGFRNEIAFLKGAIKGLEEAENMLIKISLVPKD